MSYIRSTSNPDGLYIYGTGDGIVWIHQGHVMTRVDQEQFEETLLQWDQDWETASYGRVRIEEITDPGPNQFRFRMQIGADSIVAWAVTWSYIARGIKEKRSYAR